MTRHALLRFSFAVTLFACASDRPGMTAPEVVSYAAGPVLDIELKSMNMRHVLNLAGMHGREIAFEKDLAVQSLLHRIRTIDITNPRRAMVVADIPLSDGTGSVAIANDYVYASVTGGIRVFDVRDAKNPVFVKDYMTPCGTASHTLVAGLEETMGYFLSAPASSAAGCLDKYGLLVVSLTDPTSGTFFELKAPGCTEHRQFAVHSTLNIALGLCKDAGWDAAETWDITDPYHPLVIGTKWAPIGSVWNSSAINWDGNIVMHGTSAGRSYFYKQDDAGGALPAYYEWVVRGPGPQTCSGSFEPDAADPYYAAASCGGSGFSFLSIAGEGSTTTVAEDGFYRPVGAAAWSAYAYNHTYYVSDQNRGLDIISRNGPRTGKNPETGERIRLNSRSVY
jgi:hypothetical protein